MTALQIYLMMPVNTKITTVIIGTIASGRDSNSDLTWMGGPNLTLFHTVLCPYNTSFYISDDLEVCKAVKIDVKHERIDELEKETEVI